MRFFYERINVEINISAKPDVMYKYESYCILLAICISTYGEIQEERTILASKEVMEVLRDDIKKLLENDDNEVDISAPENEENFYLSIKKPVHLPERERLIEAGYSETVINDYLTKTNTFRFTICLRGVLSGVSYMTQITRDELEELLNEIEGVFSIVGKSDSVKHL